MAWLLGKQKKPELELTGMSNLGILIYATRTCYQSYDRSDEMGENDRNLLKNIMRLEHYSPLNFLWFNFTGVTPKDYIGWIGRNHTIQNFVQYSPTRETLVVNAYTLKVTEDDPWTKKLIKLIMKQYSVPIIFGHDDVHPTQPFKVLVPPKREGVILIDWFPAFGAENTMVCYEVVGLSRALLQQWVRHHLFPLVKSTRYTLRELKDFNGDVKDYFVPTGNEEVDRAVESQIENLVQLKTNEGTKNDEAKYALPEAYKTHMIVWQPIWSLRHMVKVRGGKAAMSEWHKYIPQLQEILDTIDFMTTKR